jgi:3-phenylpropionate/trans-cinnamate dioxygenase ferredoxin subunit
MKHFDVEGFFRLGYGNSENFHGGVAMILAAKTSEIPNFGKKVISVSGQEILFINIKGNIFAVENECPHQGSPLSAAVVKDGYIACPRHGYRFNLTDGRCSDHPELALKTYPVELSGDDILVDLG